MAQAGCTVAFVRRGLLLSTQSVQSLRVLLGQRLRAANNTLRFATSPERLFIAVFAFGALAIFLLVFLGGTALLGTARSSGGDDVLVSLVQRLCGFSFLFLLAGGIPFVASVLLSPGDLPLLASAPVPPGTLIAARLWDAILAASGQFLVIGFPLLVAAVVALGTPWWLWPIAGLILLLLTVLPSVVIALLTLIAARFLGVRRVRLAVLLASALLAVALCLFTVGEFGRRAERTGGISLAAILEAVRAQPAPPAFLPSTWAADALVALSRNPGAVWLPLILLLAATVSATAMASVVGRRVLLGETLLESDGMSTKAEPRLKLENLLSILAPGTGNATRAILAKDARYVMRDMVLMSQAGIPIILYFVPFVLAGEARRRGASLDDLLFLALGIVATIVYMEASIFGLSSVGLEGRAFWIPRGAPLTDRHLILAKWRGAFTASILVGAPLLVGACVAFSASPAILWGGLSFMLVACAALSGMCVGLSGMFPHFIYENPAHRASLIALVGGFIGATVYVSLAGGLLGGGWFLAQQWPERGREIQIGSVAVFLLVSLLTGALPLIAAQSRLKNYAWEH